MSQPVQNWLKILLLSVIYSFKKLNFTCPTILYRRINFGFIDIMCSNANTLHYYALRVPRKVDRWR